MPADIQSIECVLVTPSESSRIHQQHFSDPTATDVMTFSMPPVASLIVCPNIANQQRHLESLSMEEEVLTYFIHGLLHLIGLDDRTEKQFQKMCQLQAKIRTQVATQA
ncbi:MAG: rRNA maturation RNase YbeY [Candidatus Methylacidiphilales bacterium]